ncbi:MAG: hypothetical protein ABEJ48_00945 [Halobacteriales archaeon]
MSIQFAADTQTTAFYSPLEDFEEVEIDVEVREDPLTGRSARIVPENFLMPDTEPDISAVVEDDEGCFFCPSMVTEATPEYPDWVGMERGERGEAVSFPNLNPYGAHSNVVVLTEAHYQPPEAFTTTQFADGLGAALKFVRAAFEHDPDATYASINMNFLRPAGSSIVHPHMQTLVDDRGTNEQRRRVDAAHRYRDREGSTYWDDLREAEYGGDRHIGSTDGVEWIAPFAPKHHRHVMGIADQATVPQPDSGVVAGLADGITNVLAYYGDLGLNSFNIALHLVADDPACPPIVDIVARSVFEEYYWSDSPFFVALHDEGVVDVAPESYAVEAADQF